MTVDTGHTRRTSRGLTPADEALAQRRLIVEAGVAGAQDNLAGGVMLLAYALFLGATPFQIGLLKSAQMIGASLQLAADRMLVGLGTRKRLGTVGLATLSASRLLTGLLPFAAMWVAADYLAWGLIATLVLVNAAGQIVEIARLSWVTGVVDPRSRGRFLGERRLLVDLIGSVVAITAAWVLDWQKAISPARGLMTAQGFYFAAAALVIVGLFVLRTVPEPPLVLRKNGRGIREIADPFLDDRFRPLMIHYAIWHFSAPFAASFFDLYLITILKMPYGAVAIFNFIGTIASLYSVRLWGRLADRFGNLPVLRICVGFKTIFPFMWIFFFPVEGPIARAVVYALMVVVFCLRTFNSGQNIATMNLALDLMPEDRATSYLANFRTIGNWIQAFAPALAGLLATTLLGFGWSAYASLATLFVLSAVGRAFSYRALSAIPEERAASLAHVWRTMRRLPGVTSDRGWRAFVRFWGGPLIAGVMAARTGLGRMATLWRGTPPNDGAL